MHEKNLLIHSVSVLIAIAEMATTVSAATTPRGLTFPTHHYFAQMEVMFMA